MPAFRFTCQPGCANCCEQKGYVYLTDDDLNRAAAFLGLSPRQFEARYVYRTRYLLRLRKPHGAQCHFLDGTRCRIHPAKPTQCRAFPFWPELVGDRRAWTEAAAGCPGIGKGELITIQSALRVAHEMREAYPGMYEGPRPRPRKTVP